MSMYMCLITIHHILSIFYCLVLFIAKSANFTPKSCNFAFFKFFSIENTYINPFLSVHIPYVQSEGILPQIRLLQWRAYIFRNTQCFSTKLGRNMVNALFCHKTLKYWWPLTYIQGHVIQDGCQIQSEKSILGQKIAITRPIFWQIW